VQAAAVLNELNSKTVAGCGAEYGGFSSLSVGASHNAHDNYALCM